MYNSQVTKSNIVLQACIGILASGKNEKEKASWKERRIDRLNVELLSLDDGTKVMNDEDDGSDCGPSLPAGVLRSRGGWAGDSLEIGE